MSSVSDYFQNLSELLEIEISEERNQHLEFVKNTTAQERRKKGYTWFPLRISDKGYGIGEYPFLEIERTQKIEFGHLFGSGKMVSIFYLENDKESEEQLIGTVHFVSGNRMKINFSVDELPDWVFKERIGVNLHFDEKSFSEMKKALNFFQTEKKETEVELAKKLIGLSTCKINTAIPYNSTSLNESQNQAVGAALASEDVSIIHGPPGTGKTTTLTEITKALVKKGERVLLCCPSNAAADHLTEKLDLAGVNVLRIGNVSKIDGKVFEHTFDYIIKNSEEQKEIQRLKKQAAEYRRMALKYKRNFGREEREQRNLLLKEAKDIRKEIIQTEDLLIEKKMNAAEAVVTTLVGSSNRYLEDNIFNTLIIDEAAQALEPACWIPILKAEKVILAGDPFQLPPTIKSDKAQGLSKTLMEKCIAFIPNTTLLNIQYRMNNSIMQYSNLWFYDNKLVADNSVKHQVLADGIAPFLFVDTAGCGYEEKTNDNSSYYNEGEADLILKLAQESAEHTDDIAIIAPYKGQSEYLKSKTDNETKYRIDTVDSFQGQESDVVFISLTRSNEKGTIGFLKDYRRMNVAMTRAKKQLVIIGDSATLSQDNFFNKMIDFTQENNYYKSAWEYLY